jgi:hypothetical protein
MVVFVILSHAFMHIFTWRSVKDPLLPVRDAKTGLMQPRNQRPALQQVSVWYEKDS